MVSTPGGGLAKAHSLIQSHYVVAFKSFDFCYYIFKDNLVNKEVYMEVLVIIAFLAIIGLSVFGYIKFTRKGASQADKDSKIGQILNFRTFYVEGIIKIFYIICTVCSVIIPIVSLIVYATQAHRPDAATIFGFIFAVPIALFLVRICFEFTLMFIRLVTNTNDIRNSLCKDSVAPVAQATPNYTTGAGTAPQPTYATPQAAPGAPGYGAQTAAPGAGVQQGAATGYAPQGAAPGYTQPQAAPQASWPCSCGHTGNVGAFCAKCGRPRG